MSPVRSVESSRSTGSAGPGVVPPGDYVLDVDRSTLRFRAKAFCLVWVTGTMRPRDGHILVEDDTISGRGTADARSLATGLAPRNWHLHTSHYLHTRKSPDVRFRVARSPLTSSRFEGQLDVRDGTVDFPVEITELSTAGDEIRVEVSGTFDRRGLGMLPKFMGVSRLVHIELEIVARKAAGEVSGP